MTMQLIVLEFSVSTLMSLNLVFKSEQHVLVEPWCYVVTSKVETITIYLGSVKTSRNVSASPLSSPPPAYARQD